MWKRLEEYINQENIGINQSSAGRFFCLGALKYAPENEHIAAVRSQNIPQFLQRFLFEHQDEMLQMFNRNELHSNFSPKLLKLFKNDTILQSVNNNNHEINLLLPRKIRRNNSASFEFIYLNR